MSTNIGSKINQLLHTQPSGIVMLSAWLTKQGYSHDLLQRYRKSNWLESIGVGAFVRKNDKIDYKGAIYALQKQSCLNIHPGGRTALSLLGKAHYMELYAKKITLIGATGEKLPAWFRNHPWGVKVDYYETSFLPPYMGLTEIESNSFSIRVANATRAIMECLHLAPQKHGLMECFELMEGLNNLPPSQVQFLLENCKSIKVKRLFLYLAEKADHGWFEHINLKKIDLGKGKRSIITNGVYIDKYGITVPKEIEKHGRRI